MRLHAMSPIPIVALAVASFASSARATVMIPLSIDDLTAQADLVVVATPTASTAQWLSGHIVTDVTVHVESVIKGANATELVIEVPGGIVGDTGQQLAGAPSLARGQRYVLFLAAHGGHYEVVGLSQGVLAVRVQSGATVVLPADTRGLEFVAPSTGGRASVVIPRDGMPLEEFVRAVRPR